HAERLVPLRVVGRVIERQNLTRAARAQCLENIPVAHPPADAGGNTQLHSGIGTDAPVVLRLALCETIQVLSVRPDKGPGGQLERPGRSKVDLFLNASFAERSLPGHDAPVMVLNR